MKKGIVIGFLIALAGVVQAQEVTDSMRIYHSELANVIQSQTNMPTANSGQTSTIVKEKAFRPLLAVKTNLLYWVGLMPDFRNYSFIPNLELEYFFLDRWSVAAAGNYAKWEYSGDDWFGISTWSLEPRWWIWGDGQYRWIYLGLYGEVGDYDVQNNRIDVDGYTGKLWSTGLSVGAALPFSKRWGAEVGLRAGYRHSQEKAYSYEAPDYFLDAEDTGNHWGVTGIKVSLYYRFGKGNK